jgi:hypothetical protein
MRRRILEWSWITSLLLSIGCMVLCVDSLLTKGRYVLSLTNNVYVLIADRQATLFSEANYVGDLQPRVLNPRGFGFNNKPKERAYFDWRIPELGVRYCFVTGVLSFPATPQMGPHTIRYAEFTVPGFSFRWDHESQLKEPRWSLGLSLLIPLVLLLVVSGLTWRRLRKDRQPRSSNLQPTDLA